MTFVIYNSSNFSGTYKGKWEGVIPELQRRYKQTQSFGIRRWIESFMSTRVCDGCKGKRLKDSSLNSSTRFGNLARIKFPGSSVSLDSLCKRYRIDNSKREKHTALIDCDLLSKVYINLIDQKEPKLNFINETIDNYQMSKTNTSYFKKIIKPTEEEKRNHDQYLKTNLKKNFFN